MAPQACDGCRARKTKCLQDSHDASCTRCNRLRLSCTFDTPFKTRGPKKRNESTAQTQSASIFPTDSAFARADAVDTSPSHTSPRHTLSNKHLDDLRSVNGHATLMSTISADSQLHGSYTTDFFCARPMLLQILEHYLQCLYPLIPVVHRPSFWCDATNTRDAQDPDFLTLEIAICAAVIGTMPSKFATYQAVHSSYPFESRKQALYCCYNKLVELRGQDYFDEINYNKWAASYLMAIAFFQIGEHNRARMIDVESMQLGRLLHLHQVSEYEGLNCIETQLRKKGFWLLFYGYIHSQLQNLRKERLLYLDPDTLRSIDLKQLLPLDVDDEHIDENVVLSPISRSHCLTSGFITHSQVFWAAMRDAEPSGTSSLCSAAAHLEAKISSLKYMLDNVSPELRPWPTPGADDGDSVVLASQFGSIRANLHVTHLWLQSILMDRLEVMTCDDIEYQRKLWHGREDLSRQLLHLLYSIPQADIEPNGLHLAYKVRDVAVGLFGCPFQPHEPASQRAEIYVREFTKILSSLDASETMSTTNLQSWVDTDRVKGPLPPGKGPAIRSENMAWP